MKLHKNCNEEKLLEHGFSKYGTRYLYKKSVYRNNNRSIIDLIVTVELDEKEKYVTYDVITNGDMYVPYYNNEYSQKNIVLKKVKRNINAEVKKLEKSEIIESKPRRKYKRKKER